MTIEIPGFEVVKNWDAKTQARALEVIKKRSHAEAWYCNRGRSCDGKPHEGYDYKHARGDQWPPPGEVGLLDDHVRSRIGQDPYRF
jgi:hypothetical protein